jgi:hypothetical protein
MSWDCFASSVAPRLQAGIFAFAQLLFVMPNPFGFQDGEASASPQVQT